MEVNGGETLTFMLGDTTQKYRVSAVNGGIVKLFEENGTYKHMPYKNLMEMIEQGYVVIEKNKDIDQLF